MNSQRGQIAVPPPNSRKELRAPPAASLSHRLHDDHGELYARGAGFTEICELVHEKSAVTWKRGGGCDLTQMGLVKTSILQYKRIAT